MSLTGAVAGGGWRPQRGLPACRRGAAPLPRAPRTCGVPLDHALGAASSAGQPQVRGDGHRSPRIEWRRRCRRSPADDPGLVDAHAARHHARAGLVVGLMLILLRLILFVEIAFLQKLMRLVHHPKLHCRWCSRRSCSGPVPAAHGRAVPERLRVGSCSSERSLVSCCSPRSRPCSLHEFGSSAVLWIALALYVLVLTAFPQGRSPG